MLTRGNFRRSLRSITEANAGRPFLIEPDGQTWTYGDMDALADRYARVLFEAGAVPGERVVVKVDKSAHAIALYLACLQAGTIHVPLNPAFTPDELVHFVVDADPAVVVVDRAPTIEHLAEGRAMLTLDINGEGSLPDAASSASPLPLADRDDNDIAALLYTSGTTGRPKGAALTNANLRHNAEALHTIWRFSPRDHLLHTLPIFHVHGLFVALHCAMLSAIPVTFLPRFDIDAVIKALPDATVMMGVPTQYARLLADDRLTKPQTSSIRLFTSGSAPLSDVLFDAFTARTGQRICERYGMSEAGIITSNPYDGERLAGTVGHPLPGVELRVVDALGQQVEPDVTGSVEIRGPHLFLGYWPLRDATADSHRGDGFFITGDVGSVDQHRRLTLQGRSGDMIISGGENVYPKEVELVLDLIPGVNESAVIGLPHPDFGEAVTAVIVTTDDFDADDAGAVLASSLAKFKHPKKIVRVEALPRNTMGKIQKGLLRTQYAELYAV